MTEDQFELIKLAQLPDAEKRGRADYIIDTSCSLNETRAQIKDILLTLGHRRETLELMNQRIKRIKDICGHGFDKMHPREDGYGYLLMINGELLSMERELKCLLEMGR